MIKYKLRCGEGHEFEGWFRSSMDFDLQSERGQLACSLCGSVQVEKAIMAPNVAPSDKRAEAPPDLSPSAPAAAGPAHLPAAVSARMPPELAEMARRIRTHLRQNAENVGPKFAEVARAIHYDEVEPRGIYGQATAREAQELADEGIEVHTLPPLPDDAN